jgi:hypothetical protein
MNIPIPPRIPPSGDFNILQTSILKITQGIVVSNDVILDLGDIITTSINNSGDIISNSLSVSGISTLDIINSTTINNSDTINSDTINSNNINNTSNIFSTTATLGDVQTSSLVNDNNIVAKKNLVGRGLIQTVLGNVNHTYTATEIANGCIIRGGGGTDVLPSVSDIVAEFGLVFPGSYFIYFKILNRYEAIVRLTSGEGFTNSLMVDYSISPEIAPAYTATVLLQIDSDTTGSWIIVENVANYSPF